MAEVNSEVWVRDDDSSAASVAWSAGTVTEVCTPAAAVRCSLFAAAPCAPARMCAPATLPTSCLHCVEAVRVVACARLAQPARMPPYFVATKWGGTLALPSFRPPCSMLPALLPLHA
ncbi:hypothetical protein EON67_08335 [archaeon]|nr:MAG: hypothetical protein EON67_08335 [archaeon]